MNKITRFEIKNLHGYRNLDLRIKDNTLIIVGENGSGKTTILQILYYLLSGQWNLMRKYEFDAIHLTIGKEPYEIQYSDIKKSFKKSFEKIDRRVLSHLPTAARHRISTLLEQTEGRLISPELEHLCDRYGIPIDYLLREVNLFEHAGQSQTESLRVTFKNIHDSLGAQLLYLPTYRRIEQELSLIFQNRDIDEYEISQRRKLPTSRRRDNTFVELVEFGMKDVEDAKDKTRADLIGFARENLNNLTFSYLGDIVEERYASVEVEQIKKANPKTIENILNRIPEPILSSDNKQHLKEIIEDIKADSSPNEHAKVICHYFTKLMEFHNDLEQREAKIVNFCLACNDYMVDKEFRYDTSSFDFTIVSRDNDADDRKIQLQHLSSGEKQIVSLFSHLYLSGGDRYFVMIDEPELSLSVPWQRKFLSDIRSAEFCTGLIAVTHSPFIYENDLRKYAHGLGEFVN